MWELWMLSTKSVWDNCLESDSMTESKMKYYNRPVWLHCPISYPVDTSRYLGMWLDLMTTHRQTRLFSSTSTYHSTDLLTTHGVAHLVVHRTSGSTIYETIPPVRLETSVGVLSTVDMVVQWSDGPRWLRDDDEFRSRLCFLNLSLTSRPVLHLLTKFTLPAYRMAAQPLINICCPCLTSPAYLPGTTAAAVKWWERQMDLWTVDMWTT